MPKPLILLVEDNSDEVQLMCEALASIAAGIEMQVAATVAGAKALMSAAPAERLPWLVVTDHHLPDGCGQELIAHLHTCPVHSHVPVVMVSGDLARPPDLGDVTWFTKPDTWTGWRTLAQTLAGRLTPR